jgi:hypothetical protein
LASSRKIASEIGGMQNRCKFLLAKKINLQLDNNSVVKIKYDIPVVFYLIGVLIKVILPVYRFLKFPI